MITLRHLPWTKVHTINGKEEYLGPTNVSIDFYVESLGDFQITSMDFKLDMYFVERWTIDFDWIPFRWADHRLKHNSGQCLNFGAQEQVQLCPLSRYPEVSKFWRPDVYFANAKEATLNQVTTPNQVLQICPDGAIRFSVRLMYLNSKFLQT